MLAVHRRFLTASFSSSSPASRSLVCHRHHLATPCSVASSAGGSVRRVARARRIHGLELRRGGGHGAAVVEAWARRRLVHGGRRRCSLCAPPRRCPSCAPPPHGPLPALAPQGRPRGQRHGRRLPALAPSSGKRDGSLPPSSTPAPLLPCTRELRRGRRPTGFAHVESRGDAWRPRCQVLPERVYLRVEGVRFVKFLNLPRWMLNCWRLFFLDLPKKDGCQVEMPNSWRCSSLVEHG